MASKQISPAAQLLRHSKLFSLPPPLKKPTVTSGSAGRNAYQSDTATPIYPTRAAIITTNAGRARGDWGLKRNLPLNQTKDRANNIIQVEEVDSINHVTDYGYATPHAIALRKFQEMNVPIKTPEFKGSRMNEVLKDSKSVFDRFEPVQPRQSTVVVAEETADTTSGLASIIPSNKTQTKKNLQRWKFKGPWLAGMEQTSFEEYLEKSVKPRRAEFKQFTKAYLTRMKKNKLQADQLASGTTLSENTDEMSEEEYQVELIRLRNEGNQLYTLMWEFLDLPGRSPHEQTDQSSGAPATHPSAGLSYLRTENTLQNHPAIGPMREHQPVIARVLQRSSVSSSTMGIDKSGAIGIAGFVSTKPGRDLFQDPGTSMNPNEVAMTGEKKVYVVPTSAMIDAKGRTNINWDKATTDSVAVWEMEYNEEEQYNAERERAAIAKHMQKTRTTSSWLSKTPRRT